MQHIHSLLQSSLPDREREYTSLSKIQAELKSLGVSSNAYTTLSFDVRHVCLVICLVVCLLCFFYWWWWEGGLRVYI